MAGNRAMDEQQGDGETGRGAFKRRGLIAGAAVLAAGLLAKQQAEPVGAVLDTAILLNVDNTATGATSVTSSGGTFAFGAKNLLSGSTGLLGIGSGVGNGVFGQGDAGPGVSGSSATDIGVLGASGGTNKAGVYGYSGTTNGVVGLTTNTGSASVMAMTSTAGSTGLAAGSTVANAYAAFFTGSVVVNGPFTVLDPTQKHGAIKAADGGYRTLYSMESPESWLEDFGEGKVVNGKAEIALDPLFASVIQTDTYHVFLTEHSDLHLHVAKRAASGFTVEADTALATVKGKKASDVNGTFSYRIVAKPKTDKKAERLARFDVPNIKLLDPASLPKAPKTPK